MFRAFFLGTTQTKTLTLNSVVMVLSNVVFNYILIFGKFGFPALGIAGAAIGSSLAELVSLVFFILYTRSRIDCKKYGLDRIPKFCMEVLKRMLNVSFWTNDTELFLIYHPGSCSSSTWSIWANAHWLLRISSVMYPAYCSWYSWHLLLHAVHWSATWSVQARKIAWRKPSDNTYASAICLYCRWHCCFLYSLSCTGHLHRYAGFAGWPAVHSLWVMCSTYLFLVPANVYFQAVSGTGNTRTALVMELITLVIYVAYISYIILYLKMDVAFCWTSEMVYSTFILILCWNYIKRGRWQEKRI